jgi:hypothetical protein
MVTGNKIKPNIEIIDESFSNKTLEQLCLSVQISDNSFSYNIIDWELSKHLVLKQYLFNEKKTPLISLLEAIFDSDDLLNKAYKKTSVCVLNKHYTFIPNPLFSEAAAESYLNYNCKLNSSQKVLSFPVKSISAHVAFAVDEQLKAFIDYKLIGCKWMHNTVVLTEALLNNYREDEKQQVFLNISTDSFDVLVFNGKQLQLFNSFEYTTAEDFLFHLLFVFEQLSVNADKQQVIICGEVLKNSAIYEKLHKYIRHISFINRNEKVTYSYKFDEQPSHFFYSLLNQYQQF